MLKVTYLITFMLIALCGSVQAEPLRYLGLPVFYSNFTPKLAPCVVDKETNYNHCGWKRYPEEATVGVATPGPEPFREGYQIELMDSVICVNGNCQTNYGELRGKFEDTSGLQYWYIPKGFYLTKLNGKYTAVKYGNGPQGNLFPIRGVELLPGEVPDGEFIPEEKERMVYEVSCNAANECSYLGRVMSLWKLQEYLPKALSYTCSDQFCYDPQGKIIGINPKGTIKQTAPI